ncbi:hypothetical protein [Xylanimonas ulmi]|uniref:Uncharacterized protein n=1 Tax=Xylanimonas ulmi TaxID=228973 RepID=A0A4Q7M0Y4_9MICO|nr:hypothetical protein [Xylanibacterium ulmi]RZS61445.1 hypothetical protein EV386_1744 [Xylanibacterium ulmi]
MRPERFDPTLARQFEALVGYRLVLGCSFAAHSDRPCEGEVSVRAVTSCCGRTVFGCPGHHRQALARQAAGRDVDPVCGRGNNAPAWFPV